MPYPRSLDTTLYLRQWAAWAPGLPTKADWLRWLPNGGPLEPRLKRPPCLRVPAMQRRRFSLLTRMILEAAFEVCETGNVAPEETHIIYGSRNGEIQTLDRLLQDLSVSSPLSPTAFSNSVHHTPTGHFSMAVQQKKISRTLSASSDTFACSCLEAVTLLKKYPQVPVLMLIGEEMPLPPFDTMVFTPPFSFATALLWSSKSTDCVSLRLSIEQGPPSPEKEGHGESVLDFLGWLEGDQTHMTFNSNFGVYHWNK